MIKYGSKELIIKPKVDDVDSVDSVENMEYWGDVGCGMTLTAVRQGHPDFRLRHPNSNVKYRTPNDEY